MLFTLDERQSHTRCFEEARNAITGNFFADFANFSRHSVTTGWRFNALILRVHDVVVYRAWGGKPNVNEVEHHTNPLGPLQDMGPSIITK